MVGLEYQAEVPSCLCHYKDEEKGEYYFFFFFLLSSHVPNLFFNVAAYSVVNHSIKNRWCTPGD